MLKQPAETKEFDDYRKIDRALRQCQQAGYRALFTPELIDRRINAPKEDSVWQHRYITPSIVASGRTKQGSKVIVYAHTDNYFSDPDNIKADAATDRSYWGYIGYVTMIPQKEFQRLVDLDGKKDKKGNQLVYVVCRKKFKKFRNSELRVMSIDEVLEHPKTIPFLGGEERAKTYLLKCGEVFGDEIKNYGDDCLDNGPSACLSYIGYCTKGLGKKEVCGSLYGILGDSARFLGVRDNT